MVWLPDHVWEAQQASKAKGSGKKGSSGKAGKGSKSSSSAPAKGDSGGVFISHDDLQWLVEAAAAGKGGTSTSSGAPMLRPAPKVIGAKPASFGSSGQFVSNLSKGKGKSGAAVSSSAAAPKGHKLELAWKSRLQQAYAKTHKRAPKKDSLVYTVSNAPGGYICQLQCDMCENAYQGDTVQPSRKLAEEEVAMVVLQNEFPDIWETVPPAVRAAGADAQATVVTTPPSQQRVGTKVAQKRKHADVSNDHPRPVNDDPKSLLNTGLMMLAERPITKEEVEYTYKKENGSTIATVTIRCFEEGDQVFEGAAVQGNDPKACKAADKAAAAVALAAFEELIEAKKPEHEAKQKARKVEHHARWKINSGKGEAADKTA